jgi:hypothetical protein
MSPRHSLSSLLWPIKYSDIISVLVRPSVIILNGTMRGFVLTPSMCEKGANAFEFASIVAAPANGP